MAKQKKRPSKGKMRGGRFTVKVLMALAVLGVALSLFIWRPWTEPAKDPGSRVQDPGSWVRRETRPVLSPALFVGKAAWAYEIAQEIPDVLDQLYCYCYCDKNFGHKSLLSCYTDGHAAT